MTLDRRVADALEVIEFLRAHLGVDKVVVLADAANQEQRWPGDDRADAGRGGARMGS